MSIVQNLKRLQESAELTEQMFVPKEKAQCPNERKIIDRLVKRTMFLQIKNLIDYYDLQSIEEGYIILESCFDKYIYSG